MGEHGDQKLHEVIGREYCEHDGIDLVVVRKVLPKTDSSITVANSANNEVLFRIDPISAFFKATKKRVLTDAQGKVVLTCRTKYWSMHGRWSVHRGESKSGDDLMFTAKLRSMFSWKSRLKAFLPDNKTEKVCDYNVAGKTRDKFYAGNNENEQDVIALTDEYMVNVKGGVDYAFIAALIAILDGMNDLSREQRSRRESALSDGLNTLAGS